MSAARGADPLCYGKSYYLKEDLILEMLSHLREREPIFAKYFYAENVFADLGYPFGTIVDLATAARSCHLLTAPGPQASSASGQRFR